VNRWDNVIKLDLKETTCEDVNWSEFLRMGYDSGILWRRWWTIRFL